MSSGTRSRSKIDSKTETAAFAVCGLQLCRFVFVLESILTYITHGIRVYPTVLKSVEPHLVHAWIST